jgi:Family of unknown function (DUF5755)
MKMAKKCIPGLFCIENMTMFLLLVIIGLVFYYFYCIVPKISERSTGQTVIVNGSMPQLFSQPSPMMGFGLASRLDTLSDPYAPPLKNDALFYPSGGSDIRGLPVIAQPVIAQPAINVQTRGLNTSYQQVGILTKSSGNSQENMILPLMGRRTMAGRDKWQYYTISNTGNMNTKLPISVNGRSCTSENGCDSIYNGDTVYVEGYQDTFRVTVYENNLFQYLPVL